MSKVFLQHNIVYETHYETHYKSYFIQHIIIQESKYTTMWYIAHTTADSEQDAVEKCR